MTATPGTRPDPPPTREAPVRSVARNSATVAAWTLVSRVTGLLRVVVIGAVLGPTWLANSFLATNTVPSLTYSVVAGPVLALVVVPALVSSLVHRGAGRQRPVPAPAQRPAHRLRPASLRCSSSSCHRALPGS